MKKLLVVGLGLLILSACNTNKTEQGNANENRNANINGTQRLRQEGESCGTAGVSPEGPINEGNCDTGLTCYYKPGVGDAAGSCIKLNAPSNDNGNKNNDFSRVKGEGEMCGGIAGFTCAEGLECQMEGKIQYPDQAGTCVKAGTKNTSAITNFKECAEAMQVVMESYPRRCRTPDGRTFVEEVTVPVDPPIKGEGEMCGGIAGFMCEAGLTCKMDGDYPDASGTCIRQSEDTINFDTSCTTNSDCRLLNTEFGVNCCGLGSCDPLDFSLPKWQAVNTKAYEKEQISQCSAVKMRCPMMPTCQLIKSINEDYRPSCVNKTCVKALKETEANTVCQSDADCWCRNFDGTKFLLEGTSPGVCDMQTKRCGTCYYK